MRMKSDGHWTHKGKLCPVCHKLKKNVGLHRKMKHKKGEVWKQWWQFWK